MSYLLPLGSGSSHLAFIRSISILGMLMSVFPEIATDSLAHDERHCFRTRKPAVHCGAAANSRTARVAFWMIAFLCLDSIC